MTPNSKQTKATAAITMGRIIDESSLSPRASLLMSRVDVLVEDIF